VFAFSNSGNCHTSYSPQLRFNITSVGHVKMSKQNCTIDATKYFSNNHVIDAWNSLPDFIVAA